MTTVFTALSINDWKLEIHLLLTKTIKKLLKADSTN